MARGVFVGSIDLEEDEAVVGALFAEQIEADDAGLQATRLRVGLGGRDECLDVLGNDVNEDLDDEHPETVARVARRCTHGASAHVRSFVRVRAAEASGTSRAVSSPTSASERRFAAFSWGVLVFNLAVILWGAYVRATGSGAGCGEHWPDCNGSIVPRAETIETAIELTHRLTSGLALIAVVVQLVWALRVFPVGHRARTMAKASMVFMVLEAAVGAMLVLLRYVAHDQSAGRAVSIAVHLVNTFLLVASLTLTPWSVRENDRRARSPGTRWLHGGGALLLLVTGVAGAITALGDTLFPAETLASGMAADLSPTAHFLVRLRVIHPLIAGFGSIYLLLLAGFSAQTIPAVRRLAGLHAGLVLTQLTAGLVNLWLLAPVWMQLVHLLLADLVWISFVLLADAARIRGSIAVSEGR